MTQIIGFLDWPDFLAEIRNDPPQDGIIRVQPLTQNIPNPRIGQAWVEYWLIVAATTKSGNLVVARFKLGGAWDFHLRNDASREQELQARVETAAGVVRGVLLEAGFAVRPGIVVGSGESKVSTTPTGLWEWGGDGRLTACTPDEAVG